MLPVVDFIHTNRDRYVTELKDYLAIPSISALPAHTGDVRRCAEWTAEEMRRSRTPTHPAILAAKDPVLLEHRDHMFERHLGPLEF